MLTFGFTLLTSDIAIGRKTQKSAIGAYEEMHPKWKFLGVLTFLVPVLIMTYYAVIGGWITKYACVYLTGQASSAAQDDYFTSFITSPVSPVVFGLLFMAVTAFIVYKGVEGGIEKVSKFMMPVLLLGGIRFGIFTPTEGGAFAAIYAIAVCMLYYRELSFRDLLRVSARAAHTTSVVMLVVAAATAVGWFITIAQIPNQMTALFTPLIDNPIMLLLAINLFLFLIGMVMDLTPNILIFAPVFYPLIQQAGIDPYYFGLLFVLNLGIGVITPPVGTVLYVVCGIGNIKITQLVVKLVPFILIEVVMLLLLLFFPSLSLTPLNWLMGGN